MFNSILNKLKGPIEPGNCYAFKGERAQIFFKLAKEIYPKSFTIEHISKDLSITKSLDSAPKEFEIFVNKFFFKL